VTGVAVMKTAAAAAGVKMEEIGLKVKATN
jgi:hypothetical protein